VWRGLLGRKRLAHHDLMDNTLDIAALGRAIEADTPGCKAVLVETHISWVLLCGDFAYKLKKPLKLDVLDFSTPELRRRACEEELRLNRRFAPGTYLDVMPIFGTPASPSFKPGSVLIDHAVCMRRFPDGALFSEMLAAGALTVAHVDHLARKVAAVHGQAPRADADRSFGSAELVEEATATVVRNLNQQLGKAAMAPLVDWLVRQATVLRPTWTHRLQSGMVRECHGDLHLGNAAIIDGEPSAFDCIEFDPGLRWIDIISDTAFMVMDLLAHGRRDLAYIFLNAWLEITGDHGGLSVLHYYMVYRALVRAWVQGMRRPVTGTRESMPNYVDTARALTETGDARLMITHGLSGSGKSFVSGALLGRCGAIRLRSDVERKRVFGLQPLERSTSLGEDRVYSEQATRRTFDTLRDRARMALDAGYPTIVDAAFLKRSERDAMRRLAAEASVPFVIAHCHAQEATLRRRIAARLAGPGDASEADERVLQMQLAFAQPLSADEAPGVIDIDTSITLDLDAMDQRWKTSPVPTP
jgi:uncharacterized protein